MGETNNNPTSAMVNKVDPVDRPVDEKITIYSIPINAIIP
ncbi:hypothetical protein GCM10023142_39290 [Anaerocolumna aminovalerica]